MPSKERAGGKELETRIPLKWKVLGLHTLVVGYAPIIEKELSSPLVELA